MNELALFAGAGGGILGGKLLGWRTVCAVECEPYPASVLAQRQNDGILPPFPIWDDVCTFDGRTWAGIVDVISGGFPCQDISVAGKGQGITGKRSGLWKEFTRIIGEIQPRFVFVENSPMLTSRGLGTVLGDLASMGFNARWGVLGADAVGFAHHRARIWVVANTSGFGFIRSRKGWPEKRDSQYQQLEGLLKQTLQNGIPAGKRNRVHDGVAARVDRLKAIGNGQVPLCAATAWNILTR